VQTALTSLATDLSRAARLIFSCLSNVVSHTDLSLQPAVWPKSYFVFFHPTPAFPLNLLLVAQRSCFLFFLLTFCPLASHCSEESQTSCRITQRKLGEGVKAQRKLSGYILLLIHFYPAVAVNSLWETVVFLPFSCLCPAFLCSWSYPTMCVRLCVCVRACEPDKLVCCSQYYRACRPFYLADSLGVGFLF